METFKEVKESLFDAAKTVEKKVVGMANDIGERAIDAKDKVMEVADRAIDKIKDLGSARNDVLADLKKDHELVSGLFDQLPVFKTSDKTAVETCQGLFAQLKYELETHAALEEKLFYPALQKFDAAEIKEALTEHARIRHLLTELSAMNTQGAEFSAKLGLLKQLVQHHVRVEETQIFDLARTNLTTEQLESMSTRLEQERLAMDDQRRPKQTASDKATDRVRGNQAEKPAQRVGAKSKKSDEGLREHSRHRAH